MLKKFLLFILLTSFILSKAQLPSSLINDDDFDTRNIVVNINGLVIEATILNENLKVKKVKESSYYTWYAKNMIITTQGGFSGHLLHKKYTAMYENNQLQEQGQYNYGLKQGKWMKWQLDGKLISVESWKKGVKQGEFKSYRNGIVSKVEKYKNNKIVGKLKVFDNNGKLITSVKPETKSEKSDESDTRKAHEEKKVSLAINKKSPDSAVNKSTTDFKKVSNKSKAINKSSSEKNANAKKPVDTSKDKEKHLEKSGAMKKSKDK